MEITVVTLVWFVVEVLAVKSQPEIDPFRGGFQVGKVGGELLVVRVDALRHVRADGCSLLGWFVARQWLIVGIGEKGHWNQECHGLVGMAVRE